MARRRKGLSNSNPEFRLFFDSTKDLAEYLRTHEPQEDWKIHAESITQNSEYHMEDFAGVRNVDEAFTLLEYGDANSAARIKAKGNIRVKMTGASPSLETAVVGCVPHIPNYIMGLPKQMMKVTRIPRKIPVIDVYLFVSFAHHTSADSIADAGLAIANAVNATELKGVRVNLYAVCGSADRHGHKYAVVTKIKDAKEPLNLLNVAFPIVHPAFFRVCYLLCLEANTPKYLSAHGWALDFVEIKALNLHGGGALIDVRRMADSGLGEEYVAEEINKCFK